MENKTYKYFQYAFGEIVLVVVGILIAFQVNNWKDANKDHGKKLALLKALEVEFSLNLNQLDNVIYYDQLVVNSTSRLQHLTASDPVLNQRDSLRLLVQQTNYLWTFDAQNGALRSGISSGTIHLIKNDSLINLLFGWPDVVADAKENEDRTTQFQLNSSVIIRHVRSVDYFSIMYPELGPSKFSSDYMALLNDPEFEDYISERNIHTLDAINELQIVKKQNKEILRLLHHELNLIKQ